jgi:hypothetical protein
MIRQDDAEVFMVDKIEIISKLEPLPSQYKEIPIENYDRTEYTRTCPSCKHVFEYKNGCCGCFICPKCNYRWNCNDPFYIPVIKTVSHPYPPTPVTTYHCPKCDKQLWGTCGMPIKQYANEPCQECKDKEKPAPKSFKFDIIVGLVNQNYTFRKIFTTIDGDSIQSDNNWSNFKNLIAPDWIEIGKTYTVEIKEKE